MTMKYLSGVNQTLNSLVKSSEEVAKGRQLIDPEDDPVKYLTAFNLQRAVDDSKQYMRNANNALVWISNEDTELQSASAILSRAKDELAIQGINDSQDADSRKALAGEVYNIYQEMIDIGNAQYMDRYVFGGYETEGEPFTSGNRQVTSVVSNKDGGEAFAARLYSDMPDLAEGSYTITAQVMAGGVVQVSMVDSNNKNVIIDSNGSDESTENGNLTTDLLVTEFSAGQVISTGRGVSIKLPDDISVGETLKLSYYYVPGDDIQYIGDDGEIESKIGANQSVKLNISGRDIFMETNRTVLGSMPNTANGLSISETTKFSNIDGANVNIADGINFSGTDHNGYRIGTARVTSPANVDLDMTNTTDDQRTLTIDYAGKQYSIMLDKAGYEDMDEVVYTVNRLLENEGLGGEMNAVNDGDKLMFISTKAGSGVKIGITGSDYNALGFHDTPVTDTGSDTTFDIAYSNYMGPVETTYTGLTIAGTPGGTDHTYTVQDEEFTFTVLDTDTASDIQDKINAALKSSGMEFEVDATVTDDGFGGYDLTFTQVNQNYTKETYLTTKIDEGASEYQYASAKGGDYPMEEEKTISDMLDFIEDLYDNAVVAEINNGKLQVTDIRSGESRLSFNLDEQNTGIGYAMLQPDVSMTGRYSGTGDDSWSVDVSVVADDIVITVADSDGTILFDNSATPLSVTNYTGDPLYINQGVSIVLGDLVSSSFTVEMSANSNLSFGDLNIIEDGSNVDVFRSLQNLYDALDMNIPDSGVGAPSAWTDAALGSSATPYFDGEFRGNYNDKLTFEVEYYGDASEYYLQSEQYWESDDLTMYNSVDPVSFDIVLQSDTLPNDGFITKTVSVAAAVYAGDETALKDEIIRQINSDSDMQNLGVHAYTDDGNLRIDSGSGNTELTVHYNNTETAFMFGETGNDTTGTQVPSLEMVEDSTLEVFYETGGAWETANPISITIPAGTQYADNAAMITDINAQLDAALIADGFGAGDLYAEMTSSGTITIKNTAAFDDIVVSGDDGGELGFYPVIQANTIETAHKPTLDLSEKSLSERTMTFYTDDGSGTMTATNIIVDKENYQSLDELVDNINQKLSDAGLTDVSCGKMGESQLSFSFGGAITSMHVAGDYEGTLGIERGGDIAKMKVTGSDGTLVSSYIIDTANEQYYIADGVYHHYDAGTLAATDSYTVAVGSGIEHELPVLSKAESQIHTALTTVGNRQNRAESAITFNQSLITKNEEIKAGYTGSTTLDQTESSTNYTVAQTVYQAALSSTAEILKLSIMNYL